MDGRIQRRRVARHVSQVFFSATSRAKPCLNENSNRGGYNALPLHRAVRGLTSACWLSVHHSNRMALKLSNCSVIAASVGRRSMLEAP